MRAKGQAIGWLCCIFLVSVGLWTGDAVAATLFEGRQIHLSKDDNRVFKIGITGTTAGYNFIALVEDAQQESIALGDLGYWELVDDPPSVLRNYDLQLNVKNNFRGKFQIEFEYDRQQHDIVYRVLEGPVQVRLDRSEYYPTMVIEPLAAISPADTAPAPAGFKRHLFFDFNSFDADLRKYYGRVKRLLKSADFTHYFYYYESGNYNSYYFKIYDDADKLDTDKMGLSLEDGTLGYYQKVLDNLKSRHGVDFANQVIIVSRFGKKFSKELKQYALEIGWSKNMTVTLWSYEDIQ